MATKRITELNTLTAALLVPSDDLLMVIDHSAAIVGKNKNMTVQSFLSGAGGSEPLPYKYKETFNVHSSDKHLTDSRNALLAPHTWIAPPTGEFPNTARIRCWAGGSGGGGGNNGGGNKKPQKKKGGKKKGKKKKKKR